MRQSLRYLQCLIAAILAAGCQPNTQTIGRQVGTQLQQQIDSTFRENPGEIAVVKMTVVHDTGHKYEGLAEVAAYGGSVPLRLSVVADLHNAIYNISPSAWSRFEKGVYAQKLAPLTSDANFVYSNVAVDNATILSCFPSSLKKDKQEFAERLDTVVPVVRRGIYFIGTGCKAHECGSEQAAWAINTETGKGVAIIQTVDRMGGEEFSLYGTQIEQLPPPLLEWAIQSGMTDMNSAVVP